MSNNRASRKGIGVERSDYDVVKHAFECAGIAHVESRGTLSRDDTAYEHFRGRGRIAITLSFETTTLYFDTKGAYVGREYMARDECDYFTAREKRDGGTR